MQAVVPTYRELPIVLEAQVRSAFLVDVLPRVPDDSRIAGDRLVLYELCGETLNVEVGVATRLHCPQKVECSHALINADLRLADSFFIQYLAEKSSNCRIEARMKSSSIETASAGTYGASERCQRLAAWAGSRSVLRWRQRDIPNSQAPRYDESGSSFSQSVRAEPRGLGEKRKRPTG